MRPEDVAAEIAARTLVAVGPLGLKSAHYPAPSSQPNTPALILWLRGSSIVHGSDQLWLLTIEGWLLTEEDPGLHKAVPVVDGLITPIVDAFGVGSPNWALGHQVDFCEVRSWTIPEGAMVWNNTSYYLAKIVWNVKVHRQPGEA